MKSWTNMKSLTPTKLFISPSKTQEILFGVSSKNPSKKKTQRRIRASTEAQLWWNSAFEPRRKRNDRKKAKRAWTNRISFLFPKEGWARGLATRCSHRTARLWQNQNDLEAAGRTQKSNHKFGLSDWLSYREQNPSRSKNQWILGR